MKTTKIKIKSRQVSAPGKLQKQNFNKKLVTLFQFFVLLIYKKHKNTPDFIPRYNRMYSWGSSFPKYPFLTPTIPKTHLFFHPIFSLKVLVSVLVLAIFAKALIYCSV